MARPVVEKPCADCEGLGVIGQVVAQWGGESYAWEHADCATCAGVGRIVGRADCAECLDTKRITVDAPPYVDAWGNVENPGMEVPCFHCMPKKKATPADKADVA